MSLTGALLKYAHARKKPRFGDIGFEELPEYKKSQYEDTSGEQLYKTYSRRAAGKDVGFQEGDLRSMQADAIDESASVGSEMERRSMAGRRGTGFVSSAGINRIRDKAILATQLARTRSLRDIAIRNSVLKRQETWQGIRGLHDFLNTERRQALSLWEGNMARQRTANQYRYTQHQHGYQDSLINWQAKGQLISDVDQLAQQAMMAAATAGAGGGAAGAGASAGAAKSMSSYRGSGGYYTPMTSQNIDFSKYGY